MPPRSCTPPSAASLDRDQRHVHHRRAAAPASAVPELAERPAASTADPAAGERRRPSRRADRVRGGAGQRAHELHVGRVVRQLEHLRERRAGATPGVTTSSAGQEHVEARRRRTWAPTGSEHPDPSSARKLRSTSTACRVGGVVDRGQQRGACVDVVGAALDGDAALADGRHEPRADRAARRSRSVSPRISQRGDGHHDRPAVGHLRQAAWRCCRAARRTSGRAAPRPAGPAGAPTRWRPSRPGASSVERSPRRARRPGRGGRMKAPITSPSWASTGRSLAECTATSARPSSTACCTSLTNTPCPPIVCSGTSWRRSPVVSTSTSSVGAAGRRRRARRRRRWAWVRRLRARRGWPGARRHAARLSAGRTGRAPRRRCARPGACRRRA